MRPTDHIPTKFEHEFNRYWKIVSDGMEFECDLERELFYISSMNDFLFNGARTNMKRTELIDKMLYG